MEINNVAESMRKILKESRYTVEQSMKQFDDMISDLIFEQGCVLEKILLDQLPQEIVDMTNKKYLELRYEALADNSISNVEDTMYYFDRLREKVKKGHATDVEEKVYNTIKSCGKSK